ncbi:MAG: phosphodiester glycosidase family protein, partial [Clostridia bacterium]|nr:phosphodiester glycosidase family protein [Clostridia bacterium]
SGYIIRNGTVYREKEYPDFSWDVLFIDDKGDFHIIQDRYVGKSKIMKKYNIVNSLHFGPSLVVDGKVSILSPASGCGNEWNFEKVSPRTAIGQIGPLHYLMCVVEGRSSTSVGYTVYDMADLMLEMGCQQAYSLDGGKSATMIFGGETMNDVLWGGERVVSDIVYFATAIPNE